MIGATEYFTIMAEKASKHIPANIIRNIPHNGRLIVSSIAAMYLEKSKFV
jgi:hypothetical protein